MADTKRAQCPGCQETFVYEAVNPPTICPHCGEPPSNESETGEESSRRASDTASGTGSSPRQRSDSKISRQPFRRVDSLEDSETDSGDGQDGDESESQPWDGPEWDSKEEWVEAERARVRRSTQQSKNQSVPGNSGLTLENYVAAIFYFIGAILTITIVGAIIGVPLLAFAHAINPENDWP